LDKKEFLERLLSEERREWQDPDKILLKLGLKRGQRFLDVGSGPGFFAVAASKLVGEFGAIYCVDSSSEAAEMCAQNLKKAGYSNFKVLVAAVEEASLPSEFFDVVLVANVLHDFSDPLNVLRSIYGWLRSEGTLGVVDWKKSETPFGPPLNMRISLEESVALVERAGFKVEEVDDSFPYHYMVKAKKDTAQG